LDLHRLDEIERVQVRDEIGERVAAFANTGAIELPGVSLLALAS